MAESRIKIVVDGKIIHEDTFTKSEELPEETQELFIKVMVKTAVLCLETDNVFMATQALDKIAGDCAPVTVN